MTTVIAFTALLIAVLLLVDRLGLPALPKRPQPKHEHIWDMWEGCKISDWYWLNGERAERLLSGQRRDCLSCGEREVRTVTT